MGRSGSNKRDLPFHSLMEPLLVAAGEPARLGDRCFHYSYCTAPTSRQGERGGEAMMTRGGGLSLPVHKANQWRMWSTFRPCYISNILILHNIFQVSTQFNLVTGLGFMSRTDMACLFISLMYISYPFAVNALQFVHHRTHWRLLHTIVGSQ